jgi:hypothetical protein
MCSVSEAGSFLRLIDFVHQSTPGLRVIKRRRTWLWKWLAPEGGLPHSGSRNRVPDRGSSNAGAGFDAVERERFKGVYLPSHSDQIN